jgi:5'-methylthioadenosine phosphorylase
VWHHSEEPVTVDMVIRTLNQNTAHAQQAILNLVQTLERKEKCECNTALASAIITDRKKIPAKVKSKLKLLVGKYL